MRAISEKRDGGRKAGREHGRGTESQREKIGWETESQRKEIGRRTEDQREEIGRGTESRREEISRETEERQEEGSPTCQKRRRESNRKAIKRGGKPHRKPRGAGPLKLYSHYVSVQIRCAMEHKASFFMMAVGQFLVSFNVFLGVYFMFCRFSGVAGFTYSQVLLCFGIVLMQFSLAECVARGFDTFHNIVRKGEFDRVMVRPRGLILQVLGSRFELTRFGRMLQAAVMFAWGVRGSGIRWTPDKVITVVFMLFGGTAVFFGVFLVYAALCFFTLDGLEFINVLTDGAREFGKYPVSIYGKWVLRLCTVAVPYALVQYYPLLYLLDRRTEPWWVFVPLLAFWFLIPCGLLWKTGVRHYQSSGS